ncbi:MAG TPA: tetratricopeptide repeat protein [Pyrinomonadaceae bacterium]|nr:tetratricopeptide repeat protein [Pyrinomonadaceae bacterium]
MAMPILPVFVSSTWLDLEPERDAVRAAVMRMKETQFVGMEYFGSRDETTRRASLDDVDRSSIYVGIFAARYGSGITEDEYRRARERGLPCLIYFKSDATIPDDLRETDAAQTAKLDTLKHELRTNHIIGPDFTSPGKLAADVAADLHNLIFKDFLTPLLERAARGEVQRAEAQQLLDGIRDFSGLDQNLLSSLRRAGFNIATGARSVAVSGDDNLAVTGDDNVVVENAAGDVVRGNKIVQEAPRPVIPTLHQLRAPVGDFVGREKEIAELLTTLRRGGSAAITGISGMGGIGKTELSFYVAERLRDAYPDAQLVLDMRGTSDAPRDPADALASCIRAFVGVEQRLPDDIESLKQLYTSVLEGKRALVLLDNASDSAQVRPLLPPAGSALLITSRNAIVLPGMKTRVTLDQLNATEARELLTGICARVPNNVADRVCYLCGYLPLAIRAAGSLLDVTVDLDPEEYAAQLGDERTRLENIGTEGVDIGVEASFNLSYERLSTDAARVFRRLSVFPATFDAGAEAAICEDEGHKHLSELVRRSLVLYNTETHRYRLHDLARLFADSRQSEAERSESLMRHAWHYLRVLGECDEFYLRGGDAIRSGLSLFDAERQNIEVGQKWACGQSGGDETAARLCNAYPDAGVFVLDLRQHQRDERIVWLEAALAAARQLKDRASEGRHLGNLGVAYAALGETRRAVEFHEQLLAIAREIGDRHGEGNALGNLGVAYADLGETRRAVEFYEQQLVIVREIGDRRGEGNALGNLGVAYKNLGEPRRAVEFHEQSLAIMREIGDRRSEGAILGNLGVAYRSLGEPRRAVEFYEQDLAIAREIGDRRGEGNALGNLGSAYAALGETRRAVEFYKQALIIDREIGDRRGEGIDLFNTSLALDELGNRAHAIAHAEAALEIFEQIESPNANVVRATLAQWRGGA